HALPVRRAHALPDLGQQLRIIRRFHRSSLGPLMDRSDRADNFAGSGGLEMLYHCLPRQYKDPNQLYLHLKREICA
ncbi:MAG: DUF3136 domain-containing protein, partial [Cyanobacteria bacterium]|nr:DUF3136 domain-containing protein [Cyanobacteriota bacterium]